MKTWKEARQVYQRIQDLLKNGEAVALATVIGIEGSVYRRPGARLLIEKAGEGVGNVSGGCLEQDVRQIGQRVIESGAPEIAHYETGTEEDILYGMGMGCDGKMDIFLQKISSPNAAVETICSCLESAQAFSITTVVGGDSSTGDILVERNGELLTGEPDAGLGSAIKAKVEMLQADGVGALYDVGDYRLFTEVLVAPPSLVLCGAGDDAIPLADYAVDMGFRVTVVDHRSAYLTSERFGGNVHTIQCRADEADQRVPVDANTYVIVKTRSVVHDEAWVKKYAETNVPYIGLLGPRSRREKIMAQLGEEQQKRVYGPVGLDIGADVPEQVALSIIAEVMAVASGRDGGHLRERKQAIH